MSHDLCLYAGDEEFVLAGNPDADDFGLGRDLKCSSMTSTHRGAPIDDAADTLRFRRVDPALELPSDPDETSLYDLRGTILSSSAQQRLVLTLRREVAGLRAALAEGWDVGPELAHEEWRLAVLEAAA